MGTEAETLEPTSIMKLKEEVKDLNCSQLDATINEASLSEFQKNEDQHFSPPHTVENTIKAEAEVAKDKDVVYHVLEGKDGSFESEIFLESPSLANIAVEEICGTSGGCKDKEKPMLVKNEQDKVMQLENDAVEAKHHIPGSADIDVLGRKNSTATSLNNARTEYKEVAEPSELPAEGNNVKDYMVEKLPSSPITSTLVDLSVQEGKVEGGEGEVMEEWKQMTENLSNDKKNLMEKVQKDDCLAENSDVVYDEQLSEAICASQGSKKEKAVTGSKKNEVEGKSSGGDPLIESGVGHTIGATPDHNHEASLVPLPINESLNNDDRSEEATQNPEVSLDKNMEVVACNGGENIYKNTESIAIEQELGKTNWQEEGIEGKEQDTSSNLLVMEKGLESIIQTEEIENEKKEGNENQQASLRDTCISTAMTSPGIQNGEGDNLEDEESTSNKFEISSVTTITEEEHSLKIKPEESGILEYASSFTLEAKEDAEKLKEEVCKRHETANSNEYIDKQITQEEEAINDQSAGSCGEEIVTCSQEHEEDEKHDVEVPEGLEVAGTSKDSEGQIMEAEDVEEHSTTKQGNEEGGEEARKPEKEMTLGSETNILSKEIHQKAATEDDGIMQEYCKVSDGEETVKDSSQEDEKKAKDPVEVFEGLETAGASEDTEKQIVEDGVFANISTESIGEQIIKESEVHERLEGAGDETTEKQITDEEVSAIDISTRSVGEEPTNWSSQEDEVFEAHETTSAGEDTGAVTLPDICAVSGGEVTSKEDLQEDEKNAEVNEEVKETNSTDSTQRPSTSIATETSEEEIQKERNDQLVGPSLLVFEEDIEGKIVEKAEINSDKLEIESVMVTEKTNLYEAEQEGVQLIGPSSLPSEEMSAVTTSFQALDVEEVKLLEHSKLDENANEAILTTEKPEANKAEDDIKYDMMERACVTEPESEHHGIERTTRMEITATENPKNEETENLFESSTSTSKQPELKIVEAHENIQDETLMEEKIQGEKRETPMVVQDKEINDEYTREDEIQDKNKIDISEIVKTRDEEVQEQSSQKDGSEVEVKEICVNVVSERVDTAASRSDAAKDTSDSIEGAVENLEVFMEQREGAEASEINPTRETGPKVEVEDSTNLEVLQQNIKQVDSCECAEIEIPYKHHHASTDKSREEIGGKNDPEEAQQVIEASEVSISKESATSEHEASGFIQTSEMECVKLEKTGEFDLKEEQDYTDATEVTTYQEEILDKDLHKSETEGVNTEERSTDKASAAKDIITVSLADEIAGQSCQEDEMEQQQIEEPAPELKGEDLLHGTSDADDTTMNGTRYKEVYEGCKTGDSGESKEKQLQQKDCSVKNVSVVSIGEETVDESAQAENPKEVLEGLETVNADEHVEKQIIKEDGAANDQHAVAVGEETVNDSSITMEIEKISLLESEQETMNLADATNIPSAEMNPGCLANVEASATTLQALDVEDIKLRETSSSTMETEKIRLHESELETMKVDSTDLPSGEINPGCPTSVEASATTLQALDVEDTNLVETSSITMETEKGSLHESEPETTDLVDTTDIPSGGMSPGCPASVEASATTLQALEIEHMKLEETEKISLYESELETSDLVDATDIPSGEMSPDCPASAEASVTTLQALDAEDIKLEETSSITKEPEKVSEHESELEIMKVDSTDLPSGEINPGCPTNVEASATTLQALDVEDIKLEETSSITMETEKGSLHESELETTDLVDATDIPSEGMSPGCPANVEASATTLQALEVEDMKLEETEKISLYESELETSNLVDATDIPSGEMSPDCPASAEASVTTLKALDVEDIKLEETSSITMETEKGSLHESELETTDLVDAINIPSGEMSPGCPANVEASATTLQALDVEDMKLAETSSITKEPEKVSVHESELEPTNLVYSTDLPSREMSPGCPANLEASATTLHALDVKDLKLEETSSFTTVSLHESELEPTKPVDSTDPPGSPGNVEASATTLQCLDIEAMKLEETSNLNNNANEEILAAEIPDAAEAEEGMKYSIMLEEASGTVPEDEEQGTEAEITAKICSDGEREETLQESSTPKPQELDSIETREKITDLIPEENKTQDEKLEIPSVAQKEEELPMPQEEEARKVEEDTKMGSEGRENEYLNEVQKREGETMDKSLELNPEKDFLEKKIVKQTQSSEYSKTEGSEPESEKEKSEGEKKSDELAEEPESTGACACVKKDILDEGGNESMKVKDEVVELEIEDHGHEKNEVPNATMKGTIIENPEAVDPTKKLTNTSESDAENQNHATLTETEKIESEEDGSNISISVEDQIVGKYFQEEDKESENLEEAIHKLENKDQSGKINCVNETLQGFILDAEVPHEDERPEESDKIQKQIIEEEVASQELYTASVNDEAVTEVKATDLVSIKQNFQVIDSSEKTETESAMDEKVWNKSNVSPVTKESGKELPKKEGSNMLESSSVIVATGERSSEEAEPDAENNVVASSIGFEEKSLQTVKTTETSEKDDKDKSLNLEERSESVSQLPTFEDENRNKESLTGEKLYRDGVDGIRDKLVRASDAAPQSEGPMEYANPESDSAAVGSLTGTAEEPEQKGQQSSKLEYSEQKLEIPVTEMIKDNPMIEDVPQNMENAEVETTSDQNVEANKSEAQELGVYAAIEEIKGEVPIEDETQDPKKVEVPSVPKTIEGKFSHKEEECKELKASETGSEYIEKEMQHAEHMKEENLEIAPDFICSKNDSESTDAVSLLEKETEKTEETTEDSEKETLKVDKATETGLREDEPQIQGYKKSIDGVFQEPETVGPSAYSGKDVLENSDILENENLEEEISEEISLVEKIGTVESKNTPTNEDDSPNINVLADETLAGEADGECVDATNVEPEKLTEALESVSEAQIHDMLNETKTNQNSEDGAAVKDPNTVSVGDERIGERIQEDKMGDENVSEAIPKFETIENQNEKTSEANKPLGNEFAIEEVNVEKKIEEEEEAVHSRQVYARKTVKDEEDEEDEEKGKEVVFEESAQKPDLKFVGEETVKDSHQEGQKGDKFGNGLNPSYPTIEGTGEHIKDEAPVEEILQKETEQKLHEAIVQDVVSEGENTNIQIPGQEESEVFLTDARETAERSITASLDELDNTSNMVLEEQSQVKTDFKSEIQVNGNETKESTMIEDADNLNEDIRDMSHIQPLGKEVLDKEGTTELASVAQIDKSNSTAAEEETPREVNSTKSTKEEISTGSTDISPRSMDPIEKTFGKAQVEDQKPEQTSEIESEVKDLECEVEKSTDEPKPSVLNKFSLSDHLQKSIKETLDTVGRSGDEREPKVNKEALENKVAPNIQVEEEKTDEGEDKHDQEEEEDEHKKDDSGSDAPVMVEASRDVEVKPTHKKSHNILSGVGSKVKHSIAKVKKAITGKSSHHKQSSPKQESESTVKTAVDPNL